MRLTVFGTGYLGAVHAACMADIGHEVLGVDIDEEKIAGLSECRPPFYEPGFQEVLVRTLDSGRLRFTTSAAAAGQFGDVHFICVGTPQRADSFAADLRSVDAVVDALALHLRRGALVVGKSTVPVGTASRLTQRIHSLAPAADVDVAWNPEFLREGFAVQDTLRPDRLVVGAQSRRADLTMRKLYGPMLRAGVPFISTDLATAELVKMAANSFLAAKISFINAMAEVCDVTGADAMTLAEALGCDPRIGHRFLNPGLGFGGGCLPKDIRALTARAEELGVDQAVSFLHQVDAINTRQRQRTVDLARHLVGGAFSGRHIAVLGAAFKPNSDDVRDSPALDVAARIQRSGAQVCVHDPVALDNARSVHPSLEFAADVNKACQSADLVLHLTEWPQYAQIDPARLASIVASPKILDARNALDLALWRSAGWTTRALGRP
ncbi:UDP-glucose dehydrogenase family protein [Streptomyces afghaniensis]|uniref:UDP-glucose dehydrogenase family protein n=1 Tax=Streptomyces afghaniensis TaxID=66865 RepID=UPI00277F15C3|nr:UDP-glucose/GDP-mannose dehydrogenase family protein [Streptomyces afghaniensis]MDQ1014664.1 UDPglucose 6-dehydrogenase [Streptomyces afghaniensis]